MAIQSSQVGGIIEARMGSSRLPRKVMKPIQGKPMLQHIIERVSECHTLDRIVVATTVLKEDDVLETLARSTGVGCFRGMSTMSCHEWRMPHKPAF